jgi:aromatic-L-amino-acid decarboxylase
VNEPLAADRTLELSSDQLRRLLEAAWAHLETFLAAQSDQPAKCTTGGDEVARSVIEPLPETGEPADALLARFFEQLVPVSYNTTSPGYLAYISGGGLPQAAIADLISGVTNRYVGVWAAAPAMAQIEATVIRWFCEMIGYPSASAGFLTTGGSLANLSAIVTARQTRAADGFRAATIYTSHQAHHSIGQAAKLAGFPQDNVRRIDVDDRLCVRVDLLIAQIARDRADGLTPLIVVAQAGSTNTGAVDDLEALADLAAREKLWLHADAAYGGFFMLTERGRQVMRGIERADSITLDPHKSLFLPFGTGCLLVRDRADLLRAHETDAAYMPPRAVDDDFIDFCQISPELTRDFRGLRIWLPLKLLGAAPFRSALDEKLDLARWAADRLRELDAEIDATLEIVEPQLSIVAFRLCRDGLEEAATNRLNQRLLERINAPGRVYLTSTMLSGRFVIRICVLSFRTHLDRLQECFEIIRRTIRQGDE